jgi:DNA-binding CsgD family transcriptional regulator
MSGSHDYTLIGQFIDQYLPEGFDNISRKDSSIAALESKLSRDRQFFYIADLLKMKVLFTSRGSLDMLGVHPDQFDLSTFMVHMDRQDFARYSLARAQVIKSGYGLLIKRGGISLISTQLRVKNASGGIISLLFQVYSFYAAAPDNTVYTLLLLTDLSAFKMDKHVYHFYIGDDLAMFRYPDQDLLHTGYIFSDREFEIVKLIAGGLDSEEIAGKLFLSINTVNTHRRNILKKAGKPTIHELIIEMQERGIL